MKTRMRCYSFTQITRVMFILAIFIFCGVSSVFAQGSFEFVTEWGSYGSGEIEFNAPHDIVADSSDNIYVADTYNHRVQKFDSSGNFLTEWGSQGSGDRQFYYPHGIEVDSSDNVYVADTQNHRILKYDSSGNFLAKYGHYGSGESEFNNPFDIVLDSFGNIFVVDTYNHRVQKFDSSFKFLTEWGSYGSGEIEFYTPRGIAVDTSGNVFVADTLNYRVQKFDSSGNFLTEWGSQGSGDRQFNHPKGIAVDSSDNVYVPDYLPGSSDYHRIQIFDSSGNFLTKFGKYGSGEGELHSPRDIAIDSLGNIYVADTGNHRIQKFSYGKEPDIDDFSILALNGGSLTINSASSIIGNVGYSSGVTSETNQKVDLFDGSALVHSQVNAFNYTAKNFSPSGGILYGHDDTKLNAANAEAIAASVYYGDLPATHSYDNLGDNDNIIIQSVGNLNVISISSLNYKEDFIELVSRDGYEDYFVLNVYGNFEFAASIVVLTGTTADHVLFNFLGNNSNVVIKKSESEFYGTILAPSANVEYHNPATFVGAIIGLNLNLHSDFNLIYEPFDYPAY